MNHEEDRSLEAVAEVMARLAEHDAAALTTMLDRWGGPIRATLRRIAQGRNVRLHPDDLDELALDAVLVLQDVAGSWSPEGGAMPWVWAERRLANVVDRHLGQFGPSIDDVAGLHLASEPAPLSGSDEPDVQVLLARLAQAGSAAGERHVVVQHLQVALQQVASERDSQVFLWATLQGFERDPSPANTVGAIFGMTPAAVRKVCSRVRQRLGTYAAEVPEQGLADLALVA